MLKKIISLFVILATLATLVLTAQASIATSATYMLEDFTAPEGSVGWKPEGWSIGGGSTDIQAIGHVKIDVKDLGVDMLSASAHKFFISFTKALSKAGYNFPLSAIAGSITTRHSSEAVLAIIFFTYSICLAEPR